MHACWGNITTHTHTHTHTSTHTHTHTHTQVAEPLDKGLSEDIERGAVSLDWPLKRISAFLETK